MKQISRWGAVLAVSFATSLAVGAASPSIPTFFARRDYAGLDSNFVQVADTNGDGIPDLIANQAGYVEVLFGLGNGTFRPGPNTLTAAGGTVSFVATDLNGDGKVDLAQANGNGIVVSLGHGNGTFQAGTLYPIDDSTLSFLVVGDFNGDGIPDIAIAGNTGVWLLTGKGNGSFNPAALAAPLPPGAFEIAAADFNADGYLDLVVSLTNAGTDGAGFVVLFGNGNGTFEPPEAFSEPMRPIAIAVGSLTKGGPPSIAVAESSSSVVGLYYGNGAGGFSGPQYVTLTGVDRDGLSIGDVNGDGIPDLVSSNGYVAYGKAGGGFSKPVSYVIDGVNGPTNVVLADLRNNGLTDIVTNGYVISVLLSEGKGQFEDGIWASVTGGAGCGAAADFNGDGKPDLAVVTSAGVSILLGTGKAESPFTTGTPIAVTGAACVVAGDLNGDGIPDLLVSANGSPNSLLAYLGNGDGTFRLKGTTATAASGGYVVLADFNHDGKLGFATSGNLLALGNGDGTFQAAAAIVASPPSTGFSGIAAGDINNDGWPDLVLTNNAVPLNNAFVLLNNRLGGFTQVPTSFGAETFQPILVDLNGDGNLDLVLGGKAYLGNGAGGFTYQATLPPPAGAFLSFTCVADVNGDGIPDVLQLGYNTLAVYLGEEGATYATPFYVGTGPDPGGILVENLHGQSPTAGLPDIVAPDGNGGVMVLANLTK